MYPRVIVIVSTHFRQQGHRLPGLPQLEIVPRQHQARFQRFRIGVYRTLQGAGHGVQFTPFFVYRRQVEEALQITGVSLQPLVQYGQSPVGIVILHGQRRQSFTRDRAGSIQLERPGKFCGCLFPVATDQGNFRRQFTRPWIVRGQLPIQFYLFVGRSLIAVHSQCQNQPGPDIAIVRVKFFGTLQRFYTALDLPSPNQL